MSTTETLYQVELQICVGEDRPIPVLDAMPTYVFCRLNKPESKESAEARATKLAKLNPGYKFCVTTLKAGA